MSHVGQQYGFDPTGLGQNRILVKNLSNIKQIVIPIDKVQLQTHSYNSVLFLLTIPYFFVFGSNFVRCNANMILMWQNCQSLKAHLVVGYKRAVRALKSVLKRKRKVQRRTLSFIKFVFCFWVIFSKTEIWSFYKRSSIIYYSFYTHRQFQSTIYYN